MNNKISLIHSTNLAQTDYAYASRVPSGMDLLFLAGACPLNKDGEVLHLNDYEAQANVCVANLKEALKECGASLSDVVYTRVLVASQNRSDLVTAWETIRNEFGDHDVPSTLSGVTVLGYKNQLVEIESVAAIEKPSGDSPSLKYSVNGAGECHHDHDQAKMKHEKRPHALLTPKLKNLTDSKNGNSINIIILENDLCHK